MAHETPPATGSHEHHITPPIVYIGVYIVLLFFMVATIVASKMHLGFMNNPVAMLIAVIKAGLVVLFFMQVRLGTRLIWLWAGLGFVWFTLLSIILQDYWTRGWVPVTGW